MSTKVEHRFCLILLLTLNPTMVTGFPVIPIKGFVDSPFFTPWYISGCSLCLLHCIGFQKKYLRMLRCSALWVERCIVGRCEPCLQLCLMSSQQTPWKSSRSNKSRFQWWRTLSQLMFWNKCFEAAVWTVYGVYTGFYGRLAKLKAFTLSVFVVLHQVKLVSAIWAMELIWTYSCFSFKHIVDKRLPFLCYGFSLSRWLPELL